MSPRTKKINAKIRQESLENLLSAARRLFARLGYHASSMQAIANEAQVSKGLAYHYFSSKEEILIMLVQERLKMWQPLIEGLEDIAEAKKRLLFLVDFVLDELQTKPAELRFFNSLYLTQDGVSAIGKGMQKFAVHFERLFAQERRLFSDLGCEEPEREMIFFRSILQGICLEYLLGPDVYPLQEMKTLLLQRYICHQDTNSIANISMSALR